MKIAEDVGLCSKSNEFQCIEDKAKNLPRISKSSRDSFINCRQAYYFRKILGITVKPEYNSIAIKLGSIFDEFWGHYIQGKKFKNRFQELIELYDLKDIDIARMDAVFRAVHKLRIKFNTDGEVQRHFEFATKHAVINGYIDVGFTGHFDEVKFSRSPDWYLAPTNIAQQLSTYFLSNPNYKYCNMLVVRKPELRLGKTETVPEFGDRVFNDICKRPAHYFKGYKKDGSFGVKFYRDEFEPLQDVLDDYDLVTQDLLQCIDQGRWYQCKASCMRFGSDNACEYKSICDNSNINPIKYNIKDTANGNQNT